MPSDKERLDLLLKHGAWVTTPWPITVNGVGSFGTQTQMVRSRKVIDQIIRASKKARGGRDK